MDRRTLLLAACAMALPGVALASEKKKKNASPYIPLKAVTLTITRPNGRRGAMTVEVGLNIPDAGLRALAEESQPVLRDAYLRALQPYAMRLSPGSPPNAEFITLALQRETDRVLKRRGATVLLGGVLVL
jgi:hypothetical protein